VTGDLTAAGPEVASTYRSTLDVPPPPLLDAHRPPPLAAGWTAHDVAAAPVAEMPAAVVPQTYVIRDGDDLTGIATRFYGHASAATAIWSANRDVVPDPNVLPIGAVVRLPPPWTVLAARGVDPRAIEPQAAAAPRPVEPPAPTATRPVGWLPVGQPPVAAAAPGQPVARRPAAVRVAPGETLATLARRFYGDERQAARIWEANRDRLRSPQLVVAGMELRLP
jgi:nucleoid-associated protein YgaU